MKLFEKIYTRSQKELYFLRKRELYPLDTFRGKNFYSIRLLGIAERQKLDLRTKIEARKNFIINSVTAAEVYFKDIVKVLPEMSKVQQNQAGIRELLREKISLLEAYTLFRKEKLRIGDILATYFSFQDLEQINYVMSEILNINFLDSFLCKLLISFYSKYFTAF